MFFFRMGAQSSSNGKPTKFSSVLPEPSEEALNEKAQKLHSKNVILDELSIIDAEKNHKPDTEPDDDDQYAPPETVSSCRLTPPLGVVVPSDSQKKAGYIRRVLSLLRSFGGDLSRLRVPVNFNLPKSQLQLYGESVYSCQMDLLSACDDAALPLDRFLAVLTWHLSTTRQPPFGKAPYNPILGETHHVAAGDLRVLLEQVSHHPPVSALHASNEKKQLRMTWWQKAEPKFYGGSLEVDIKGTRKLFLDRHGETYDLNSPRLSFQFLPFPMASWLGDTTIKCQESNFEATVTFTGKTNFGLQGSPNSIKGKISDTKTGDILFTLHGRWDGKVFATDSKLGEVREIYDSAKAFSGLKTPTIVNPERVAKSESIVVWSGLTNGLLDENWDVAGGAKNKVEEDQRKIRKDRDDKKIEWKPKYFVLVDGNWAWREPSKGVNDAPIKIQ